MLPSLHAALIESTRRNGTTTFSFLFVDFYTVCPTPCLLHSRFMAAAAAAAAEAIYIT